MGWWFGRILTFEMLADELPPTAGSVLSDASAGAIEAAAVQPLIGYAAYGASIRTAVQPIVDCLGLDLFDDGLRLRPPLGLTIPTVAEGELGNRADNRAAPRLERQQGPARDAAAPRRRKTNG